MLFCPICGNTLMITLGAESNKQNTKSALNYENDYDDSSNQFQCLSCVYQYTLAKTKINRFLFKPKSVNESVLGGEEAWKNVDSTEINCLKCDSSKAYYMQLQIRSADEPMTTFYRCCKCTYQWKEN